MDPANSGYLKGPWASEIKTTSQNLYMIMFTFLHQCIMKNVLI